MDAGGNPVWEQDSRAPVRARGDEGGGGAPGHLKKPDKLSACLCHRTLGWTACQKARRLALAEA